MKRFNMQLSCGRKNCTVQAVKSTPQWHTAGVHLCGAPLCLCQLVAAQLAEDGRQLDHQVAVVALRTCSAQKKACLRCKTMQQALQPAAACAMCPPA